MSVWLGQGFPRQCPPPNLIPVDGAGEEDGPALLTQLGITLFTVFGWKLAVDAGIGNAPKTILMTDV